MESQKVRHGSKIIVNGEPFVVLDYLHKQAPRTVGKMIIKMKNLLTGSVLEKTYNSGDVSPDADIVMNKAQFLYSGGGTYSFMDSISYEQFEFDEKKLGDTVYYLTDGQEVNVMYWNGNPINIDPPATVQLRVVSTEPGVRGDTATGGTKPATLETGLVVQVPLFINIDDVLVINTVTREYRERAK
jgi:elongation factor P